MRADDKEALEQLRSASNIDAAHSIQHYLYFPDERSATNVAAILLKQGFTVEDRLGADEVNWLVLAKTQAVPTEATIDAMVESLEQIGKENGGEYDGWEADIQNVQ